MSKNIEADDILYALIKGECVRKRCGDPCVQNSNRRGRCNLGGQCILNPDFSQCLESGKLQPGKIYEF